MMSDGVADWIFKVGGMMGGIVSLLGGMIAKDLYSRIGRLETSHDLIMANIAAHNKELSDKLHDLDLKFTKTLHDETRGITAQITQELHATFKDLSNHINTLNIQVAQLGWTTQGGKE